MTLIWDQLDNGIKALFGLITLIGTFLGAGKLIRLNRVDSAISSANISESAANQTASNTVSNELERLSAAVDAQNKRIEELSNKVTELASEVHRLNNGRTTALKLLKKIDLKADNTYDKFSVLLETAIINLED